MHICGGLSINIEQATSHHTTIAVTMQSIIFRQQLKTHLSQVAYPRAIVYVPNIKRTNRSILPLMVPYKLTCITSGPVISVLGHFGPLFQDRSDRGPK